MTPMPFAAPLARALLRSQSDERLVTLARDGHEGAFEEIVRRYRTPLVAFAAAYAPSERAEDVVQESLTNAWGALAGSDREIALKPWLYTIVRNRALNARRDTRYHSELDETIDGVHQPDEIVLQREELSRAVAAVSALPDEQRKALVASALEGRTHDQIAEELGTSPGSVRGLIHRGRVAVRGAAGSLVPMPIVAWAAGSGSVVAGGVAASGVAGGSLAAKGAAVAAIAVLATGSGIVVERSLNDSARSDRQAGAAETVKEDGKSGSRHGRAGGAAPATERSRPGTEGERHEGSGGEDRGRGSEDSGSGRDDSSGPGGGNEHNSGHGGGDDDSSGHGSGGDDDSSGHGSGGGDSSDSDDDSSGSGSSGSGVDDSAGHGSGGDDSSGSSGSGSSGSGSSGSGSSGSGSSGSGSDADEVDDDGES